MKKIYLLGHRHDQPAVVSDLQEAGLIEVTEIEPTGPLAKGADEGLFAARAEQLGLELTKVQFVLDFLKKAAPAKTGLISGLVKERIVVGLAQFQAIDKKLDFETLYLNCEELEDRLVALERERRRLQATRSDLDLWHGLGARFDELKPSAFVGLAVGQVKRNDLDKLGTELEKACDAADIAFVGASGPVARLVVLYYAAHGPAVERALAAAGFEYTNVDAFSGTPEIEINNIDTRLAALGKVDIRIRGEIAGLLPLASDVTILHDWLEGRRFRYETQSRFGQTASIFALQGWVEAGQSTRLAERLNRHKAVIDFTLTDPDPSDKVPIILKNPKWLRPFEVLTRLYGVPDYRELDPTPVMAVFFFLFFGIALGDFGYGLILTIFCLWLKRRLLLTPAGKDWLNLFALGGVSSAMVGVLTGGYFGIEAASLPGFLRALIIIDPLSQAFVFLLATWVIGVIHVVSGLAIEFWDNWRRGESGAAFFEALPRILIVLSASAAVAGWLAATVFEVKTGEVASATAAALKALGLSSLAYVLLSGGLVSGYIAVFGRLAGGRKEGVSTRREDALAAVALAIIILALALGNIASPLLPLATITFGVGLVFSRPTRQALGGLGLGLYNLYGMSGFIGDILSYSRLMALGLATFLIGFAINIIAGLVAGFSPFGLPIGVFLALIIAIPFHAFNLIINLLGAFVHPLRLQFVEFFSKFYEDGGKPFRPFSFETEHLIFKEE